MLGKTTALNFSQTPWITQYRSIIEINLSRHEKQTFTLI